MVLIETCLWLGLFASIGYILGHLTVTADPAENFRYSRAGLKKKRIQAFSTPIPFILLLTAIHFLSF